MFFSWPHAGPAIAANPASQRLIRKSKDLCIRHHLLSDGQKVDADFQPSVAQRRSYHGSKKTREIVCQVQVLLVESYVTSPAGVGRKPAGAGMSDVHVEMRRSETLLCICYRFIVGLIGIGQAVVVVCIARIVDDQDAGYESKAYFCECRSVGRTGQKEFPVQSIADCAYDPRGIISQVVVIFLMLPSYPKR